MSHLDPKTNLGQLIEDFRDYVGWSVDELAQKIKKDKKTIRSWKNDPDAKPHPSSLRDFAEVIGVELGISVRPGELKAVTLKELLDRSPKAD